MSTAPLEMASGARYSPVPEIVEHSIVPCTPSLDKPKSINLIMTAVLTGCVTMVVLDGTMSTSQRWQDDDLGTEEDKITL